MSRLLGKLCLLNVLAGVPTSALPPFLEKLTSRDKPIFRGFGVVAMVAGSEAMLV